MIERRNSSWTPPTHPEEARRLSSDDGREADRRRLNLIGAGLAALLIFLVDTVTQLHSGIAVLYVTVLVIADDGSSDRRIVRPAMACAFLGLASFLLHYDGRAPTEPLLRLGIDLAALIATAVLLLHNHGVQTEARRSDVRYRKIFDTLAVAIWEHDFSDVGREIAILRAIGVEDLRGYLESHPEDVVRLRRLVRITDANDTALRLLQVSSKEQFFSHLSDFLPEEDESFLEGLVALDEGRAVFETATQVRNVHGERIDVFINLNLADTGDGLTRVVGTIMDVTDRRRVQDALDRTRAELDLAIRAATVGELSASIAHEVSQPISAVLTFTDAARRWLSKSPPDVGEALEAIRDVARAATTAGEVVDRVRKLVSWSSPDRVCVDLDGVIRSAVDVAQRRLVGTTLDVGSEDDVKIVGDPVLLQHLLVNIINNAVEAMDRAAVAERRIGIRVTRRDGEIAVVVADSGPGFAADAVASAFDPFFSTREGGVGIGLAMCRSIVAAHDGTIGIARSDGLGGAEIRILLPLPPRGLLLH